MNKLKNKNGITLVALIITIIVLLILAMVSISLVMNSGIITKSKTAVDKYSEEELQEQIKLAHSEFEMQKYGANPETDEATFLHSKLDPLYGAANVNITGTDPLMVTVKNNSNTFAIKVASNGSTEQVEWIQDKTVVTNTKTGQTLEVGDTVFYDSGVSAYEGTGDNQGKWGILGVEDGKLLIMSKENVGNVTLAGKERYLNASTLLNNACTSFKNSEYADSVRSVKAEDINRVMGYIPASPITYTYTMVDGKVKRNDQTTAGENTYFEDVNGTVLTSNNSIDVTANLYSYQLISYLASGTKSYNFLNDNGDFYWLDSKMVNSWSNYASWSIGCICYGGYLNNNTMWFSTANTAMSSNDGVRAVVSLKSNIQLSGDSTNGWTIQ